MEQQTISFSDAAGRYALSLYQLATEQSLQDVILKNVNSLNDILLESEDFRKFIHNPTIKKNDLHKVLDAISKKYNFHDYFINFIKILIDKSRIFFLGKILKDFLQIYSREKGEVSVRITLPNKLSSEQTKEVEQLLKTTLKKDIKVDFRVDSSLISGSTVQIGSLMIDNSAKSKFNKILNNI